MTATLCPLAPGGLCLYDACPYWDQAQELCTACFQEAPAPACGEGDAPCLILWQEDSD